MLLAVASLFAWSLLAVGAWAAILAWRRDGLRSRARAVRRSAASSCSPFHGAFSALTGFDPIGTVRATEEVYRLGVASMRPYWYWLLGSPVGFLLVLGLPITWLALRELARGTPEAVAIFAVLAIAAVMGFTKAETERIWLFFAPFVCLAAARALAAPAGAARAGRGGAGRAGAAPRGSLGHRVVRRGGPRRPLSRGAAGGRRTCLLPGGAAEPGEDGARLLANDRGRVDVRLGETRAGPGARRGEGAHDYLLRRRLRRTASRSAETAFA